MSRPTSLTLRVGYTLRAREPAWYEHRFLIRRVDQGAPYDVNLHVFRRTWLPLRLSACWPSVIGCGHTTTTAPITSEPNGH